MFRREFFMLPALLLPGVFGSQLKKKKFLIVHHTLFWLKDPKSVADRDRLMENLRTLTKIENHRTLIGVPLPDVNFGGTDSTYDVSLVTYFDDRKGREAYESHPVHRECFDHCRDIVQKFVTYDTRCEIPD